MQYDGLSFSSSTYGHFFDKFDIVNRFVIGGFLAKVLLTLTRIKLQVFSVKDRLCSNFSRAIKFQSIFLNSRISVRVLVKRKENLNESFPSLIKE